MSNDALAFHYVCTLESARKLAESHNRFWVTNCGCRERKGKCDRSLTDVCLVFNEAFLGSGTERKEVVLADVQEILHEAREKHLVSRPFRDETKTSVDGICFCCDDCCYYFLNPQERCDKGELMERTDMPACNDCGECVDVCYFKARSTEGGGLAVDSAKCYGCGLCVDVCPEGCVRLVARE